MLKKKLAICLVFVLLASFLASCSGNAASTVTETWTSAGTSVCAWFSEDAPADSIGVNTDPETMRVGKTPQNKDIFSLLHLPMRGTLLHNEIKNARLYLKVVDGATPSSLRIGLVNGFWSNALTDLAGAKKLTDRESAATFSVKKENDGWVSVDITGFVRDWLSGSVPNCGIVLLGKTAGEQTAFASDWDATSKNPPRLEVTGAVGKRDFNYGKFAYLRHPENTGDDAKIAENETTNCLSYALRDTNIIGAKELGLGYAAMTELYRKSGEDAVAEYCAKKVMDYVERNKAGLKVSGFRQIENFDSEIDPTKEYRIAFRIGCKLYGADDVLDEVAGNFDFHVWAQLNTGQWAQKFMFSPSEIVPCTPPGVSPAKYAWDATLGWGQEKFYKFYTSKIIYFAVTKDVDGFTQHRGI